MLKPTPRTTDIDGSILWVIDKYKHDEWFHTITRLNKYCFIVHEETEYLPYMEPVARSFGAYCSNLLEFIEWYEKNDWIVVENVRDKKTFKLTELGEQKLSELVTSKQNSTLENCLGGWDDMSVLLLVDEVYESYPEYSL